MAKRTRHRRRHAVKCKFGKLKHPKGRRVCRKRRVVRRKSHHRRRRNPFLFPTYA